MKKIIIIGAGRSSVYLIEYLCSIAEELSLYITVADADFKLAEKKVINKPFANAIALNITDEKILEQTIKEFDIVVSMLPASLHMKVAKLCLKTKKHLFTASYVSPEMAKLSKKAAEAGLLFMNECGLDPGIDHMSAMKIIDELNLKGAEIFSFKSYCGGLVAPESNDNPWGYKFSWNPKNVILAGQSTAAFLQNGKQKFLPSHRLFAESEKLEIIGMGKWDAYANRDSISYKKVYGLKKVKNLVRGTIRQNNFCGAWNVFVQAGLTDDNIQITLKNKTYREFFESFLPGNGSLKEKVLKMIPGLLEEQWQMVEWTGITSDEIIPLKTASPAEVLQNLLEQKWKLKQGDKDMILMQHIFEYKLDGKKYSLKSNLTVIGEDEERTAMAKTVGLPLAMVVKLFIEGKIKLKGVHIPIAKDVYEPVLKELEKHKIIFYE